MKKEIRIIAGNKRNGMSLGSNAYSIIQADKAERLSAYKIAQRIKHLIPGLSVRQIAKNLYLAGLARQWRRRRNR